MKAAVRTSPKANAVTTPLFQPSTPRNREAELFLWLLTILIRRVFTTTDLSSTVFRFFAFLHSFVRDFFHSLLEVLFQWTTCSVPISDLHLLLYRFDEVSECSILLPFVQVRQLMVLRLLLELYIAGIAVFSQ